MKFAFQFSSGKASEPLLMNRVSQLVIGSVQIDINLRPAQDSWVRKPIYEENRVLTAFFSAERLLANEDSSLLKNLQIGLQIHKLDRLTRQFDEFESFSMRLVRSLVRFIDTDCNLPALQTELAFYLNFKCSNAFHLMIRF